MLCRALLRLQPGVIRSAMQVSERGVSWDSVLVGDTEMRRLHFCISAFAVVILAWGWVMAQDGATLSRPRRCLQTIEGSVEDQTEAVIPEAKLILKNRATGESRETVANGTGRFSFEGVLPGEYSLKAEAKNLGC